MSRTPCEAQSAISEGLMAREAPVMSGWAGPTPAQKRRKPPPVPVLYTTGVLKPPVRPNCSATLAVNG
jgi:hypothetical protein